MSPTLSIKNVPEPVVARLRDRAARNHRSLQGELLALIEAVAAEVPGSVVTPADLHRWARAQAWSGTWDAAADVRQMRDARGAPARPTDTPLSSPPRKRNGNARRRRR